MNTLRSVEGAAANIHYYGVVKVGYGSGVAGYGYLPGRTAIGWDYLPSGDGVAAHEWGHNNGRRHRAATLHDGECHDGPTNRATACIVVTFTLSGAARSSPTSPQRPDSPTVSIAVVGGGGGGGGGGALSSLRAHVLVTRRATPSVPRSLVSRWDISVLMEVHYAPDFLGAGDGAGASGGGVVGALFDALSAIAGFATLLESTYMSGVGRPNSFMAPT